MTFRRSLYISMFIHVLIFGSAIAFAQFGRGALWGQRDTILVSLVGPAPGAHGSVLQSGKHRDTRDQGHPVAINQTALSSTKSEPVSQEQSARDEPSLPPVKGAKGADDGGPGHQRGAGGSDLSGLGADTQFGLISPEQWAVIASAIERSKNYPRIARERGIQGVVHVRFKLKPSGEVEKVQIVKSSGYDILDDASIHTVYNAAPMPFVKGWVEVPMAYILK